MPVVTECEQCRRALVAARRNEQKYCGQPSMERNKESLEMRGKSIDNLPAEPVIESHRKLPRSCVRFAQRSIDLMHFGRSLA